MSFLSTWSNTSSIFAKTLIVFLLKKRQSSAGNKPVLHRWAYDDCCCLKVQVTRSEYVHFLISSLLVYSKLWLHLLALFRMGSRVSGILNDMSSNLSFVDANQKSSPGIPFILLNQLYVKQRTSSLMLS